MRAAAPIIEAALLQVDWENAAKDSSKTLSPLAANLRERMRRGMLQSYAPVMMLNDWAENDHTLDNLPKAVSTAPLPRMNPATARGIIALRERGLPHAAILAFARDYGRIKTTAKLTEAP